MNERHFSKRETFMQPKTHEKKCHHHWPSREMQIKPLRYHLTPVRMAIIKKSRETTGAWRKGCGRRTLYCWWDCKTSSTIVEVGVKPNSSGIRELEIPRYDPAVLGILPKRTINHAAIKIHTALCLLAALLFLI